MSCSFSIKLILPHMERAPQGQEVLRAEAQELLCRKKGSGAEQGGSKEFSHGF